MQRNNCIFKKSLVVGAFFLFGLIPFLSNAQTEKVRLKSKWNTYLGFKPSAYIPFDKSYTTSSVFTLANEIPLVRSQLEESFFNISGFLKVKTQSDMKFMVLIKTPSIINRKVLETYDDKSKQKAFIPDIVVGIPSGIVVYNKGKAMYEQDTILTQHIRLGSYVSKDEADYFSSSFTLADERIDIPFSNIINNYLFGFEKEFSSKFGYGQNSVRIHLYTIHDNKSFEDVKKSNENLNKFLDSFSSKTEVDLKSFLAIKKEYESLYDKYQSLEDENGKLINFVVAQNLVEISILNSDYDAAKKYAEAIIKIGNYNRLGDKYLSELKQTKTNADDIGRQLINRTLQTEKLKIELKNQLAAERKDEIETFYLKLEQEKEDQTLLATSRDQWLADHQLLRNEVLSSIQEMPETEILQKTVSNYGGELNMQSLKSLNIKSELRFEGSNVPTLEEIWVLDHKNYLRKRKSLSMSYALVESNVGWVLNYSGGEKIWDKMSFVDYNDLKYKLDLTNSLLQFDLSQWKNFLPAGEEVVNGINCKKFRLEEKEMNAKSNLQPVSDQTIYVNPDNGQIISTLNIRYENGNKINSERRYYSDFKLVSNNYTLPYLIKIVFEDANGVQKITQNITEYQIPGTFLSRIFTKGIYASGTR